MRSIASRSVKSANPCGIGLQVVRSIALKIGVHDLAWAEVHRNWRGRPRYQCIVSALPEGIVRLSPLEQNVLSPHELESHIRAIAGSATTQAPRSIVHPWRPACGNGDFAGFGCAIGRRAFTGPSWSSEERDALVRWRFGARAAVVAQRCQGVFSGLV